MLNVQVPKRKRKGDKNNARIYDKKKAKEAKNQTSIKRTKVCLYQEK